MKNSLTRRSLVAAAPAAVVSASLPAFAVGAHLDAALLALRAPYERTLAAIDAASPAHTQAEDAYLAAKRAQPHLDEAGLAKATGFAQADRVWTRVVNANTAVIARIAETPARTLEGLIWKATVCERESFDLDVAASIVDDLIAIGGADA